MSKQSRLNAKKSEKDAVSMSEEVIFPSAKTQKLPFFKRSSSDEGEKKGKDENKSKSNNPKKKRSSDTSDGTSTIPFFFNKEERIIPKDTDPSVIKAFMEATAKSPDVDGDSTSSDSEPGKSTEPDSASALAPTPVPTSDPAPVTVPTTPVSAGVSGAVNGPGQAYSAWDWKTKQFVLLPDIWAAKQLSNGTYTPVWAWFKNGRIDHILSNAEIKEYLPR